MWTELCGRKILSFSTSYVFIDLSYFSLSYIFFYFLLTSSHFLVQRFSLFLSAISLLHQISTYTSCKQSHSAVPCQAFTWTLFYCLWHFVNFFPPFLPHHRRLRLILLCINCVDLCIMFAIINNSYSMLESFAFCSVAGSWESLEASNGVLTWKRNVI